MDIALSDKMKPIYQLKNRNIMTYMLWHRRTAIVTILLLFQIFTDEFF